MVKLQECQNKFTLTVPLDIVRFKNWEKGQEFIINFDPEGRLTLIET